VGASRWNAAATASGTLLRGSITGLALLLLATAGAGITYNTSGSLPVGLYRIVPLHGDPRRGDVVGVCLGGGAAALALGRGYVHPRGLERWVYGAGCRAPVGVIGKPVAGVPGDTVEIRPEGVRVNGTPLVNGAVLARDHAGRALPHAPWGRRVLGADEFWVQSPYSVRSFDSRVFGPVRRGQIVDRRVALWTRSPGSR
jgi:conjugative transfer signal peptidase TraF